MSIEELMKVDIDTVYGASGYKQKVTEAPASVTIITAGEIRRYGYRNLAEILSSVPGFYVTYDRDYSYLGVRGFGPPGDYNSRIVIMVDGHQTNENVFDQGYLGTDFPVDINLIDRVEVIRGPNSSLYMANALLGVVNIVTKPLRDVKGLTASGELASYGTYESRLTYGDRFNNGLEMVLSGSYYNSHGHDQLFFPEYNSPSTNNGIAQDVDHDRSAQLFAKLSYGNFKVEAVYASREKQLPTADFGSIFNDPGSYTQDTDEYLDFQYNRKFGADWGLVGHAYYHSHPFEGAYAFDLTSLGLPSRILNRAVDRGQWWGTELAVSKKLPGNQTLIVGAEFRDNFQQDQRDYFVQPFSSLLDDHRASRIWGVYAQDEIQLRDNFVLNLGLRYDQYSTFGGTTNPRAALIYNPFKATTLKLLYGQSFRAPNAYELYFQIPYQLPGTTMANPNLQPETAKTTELVFEQGLRRDFRLVVSGYYYKIRDLIAATMDPINQTVIYENSRLVDLQGIEFTLKKQSPSGLEAGVSLSFQNAEDAANEASLVNSPHMLGQANLSVPLFHRKLFASANIEYVSPRKTLAGSLTGAYLVPNFTLSSDSALTGWQLSASLYNAFGSIHADPVSQDYVQNVIPQDGRTFRITIGRHF